MATVAITPDQNVITGEIFVAAPPVRVFEAISDPNQLPRWWGAANLYRITEWKADLRVGGKWSSDGVRVDGNPLSSRAKRGISVCPTPNKKGADCKVCASIFNCNHYIILHRLHGTY